MDRRVDEASLGGVLDFLRAAERLKVVTRSAYTSAGDPESVAEHTWRVSLLAILVARACSEIDVVRLLKICIVHDLGEAVGGDIPAPEQARRLAAGLPTGKGADERRHLLTLLQHLTPALRDEIVELWDEYEAAVSPEARLAKGLDKLETLLQHIQGKNPPDFDYAFNLQYGREYTGSPTLVAALRSLLDQETARLAQQLSISQDHGESPDGRSASA